MTSLEENKQGKISHDQKLGLLPSLIGWFFVSVSMAILIFIAPYYGNNSSLPFMLLVSTMFSIYFIYSLWKAIAYTKDFIECKSISASGHIKIKREWLSKHPSYFYSFTYYDKNESKFKKLYFSISNLWIRKPNRTIEEKKYRVY